MAITLQLRPSGLRERSLRQKNMHVAAALLCARGIRRHSRFGLATAPNVIAVICSTQTDESDRGFCTCFECKCSGLQRADRSVGPSPSLAPFGIRPPRMAEVPKMQEQFLATPSMDRRLLLLQNRHSNHPWRS